MMLVGAAGAGTGYMVRSADPAVQAERDCSSGQRGPNGVALTCSNFQFTSRTANRVEFTFNLSDGSHCEGYQEVERGGPFGLGISRGGGGSACAPAGQALRPPPPTPFPDGNPRCQAGLTYAVQSPAASTGIEVKMTNSSPTTCDVSGPAKIVFFDASGRPLTVPEQIATEVANVVVLLPGTSGVLAFELGPSSCQKASSMRVFANSASQPLVPPALVCGPLISHAVRLAP